MVEWLTAFERILPLHLHSQDYRNGQGKGAGNVFFYLNEQWYTPSLKGSGVNGVVRQCLIDSLLNDNCSLHVGEYDLSYLRKASAVVITNALMGVMPVQKIQMPDFSYVDFDVRSDAIVALKTRLQTALQN